MKNVENKVLHPCHQVWRDLTMRIQDKVSVKVHEKVLYQVVDLTINQFLYAHSKSLISLTLKIH
jgi:hypothetical protein